MESSSEAVFQKVPLPESQLDFPGAVYSVSVLKVGYCAALPDGKFEADGSISLVTGRRNIVVDTGGPWDRDHLLVRLRQRGLEPADVHIVVGTHGHSDHVGNLNLFPQSVMIVGYDISEGDKYQPNKLHQGQAYVIDECL